MEMLAIRMTLREQVARSFSPTLDAVKQWVRRNITNEKIAEVTLAFAAAVSICYLGSRIYEALQNHMLYAY
jgi:hypothetical protein